ncbi:hypothetical protein GUITHDRAFT_105708 [Guillardia theta CCMP2712]|uniref:Uncharacterized protein n=1 Tax=Guillardia theta (strain CCMP2712) TaxID=905079 RepID=L1JK82_GUITC|nr:hypothetical protein GUITHDRAFT_105708 [Guillardia theta CCMP2712]EKX48564.1 hypothetical protein GUITHDRAFT_105708 [Guillardia theta CCMP2712]|eukprot:XP_005835544.1 hypothetical protein GUITHDRAFT_105708 [Guillardia theta CCMP2712]
MPTCPYLSSGRAFLAPMSTSKEGVAEVWINIGFNVKGEQKYPPYSPKLSPICTEKQYYDFIAAIQQFFDENAMDGKTSSGSRFLCCVTMGVCFIPWMYVMMKEKSLYKALDRVVQDMTSGWKTEKPRLKECKIYGKTKDPPEENAAFDFDGYMCLSTDGRASLWPPAGCNIILTADDAGGRFRHQWMASGELRRIDKGYDSSDSSKST